MRFVKATRHRPRTGIGPARSLVARFADRAGRELEVTLRVTDQSAFCAVRAITKKRTRRLAGTLALQDGHEDGPHDLSITRFPEGSVLLGREEAANAEHRPPASDLRPPISDLRPPTSDLRTFNAEEETPQVRFAPSGKLVAWWRHGMEQHVVCFDRSGDLAERRFGALPQIDELLVAGGRQGCEHLFLTVPFTKAALPAPTFGEAVTPAYRAAFELMLGGWTGPVAQARPRAASCGLAGGTGRPAAADEACDDFWMMRGEPGEFAVAARRQGGVWQVGGVTAEAQTLTVRFEDLWLRMPAALRALRYAVEILRDPIQGEPFDRVRESFADQAPDVRVALDLAKSGGFLITYHPQNKETTVNE
jgi:hypothetical protein